MQDNYFLTLFENITKDFCCHLCVTFKDKRTQYPDGMQSASRLLLPILDALQPNLSNLLH